MEYTIYHDESKIDGYWHGILMVPIESRRLILDDLTKARNIMDYSEPMTLKKINSKSSRCRCANLWLNIAIAAMMQKGKKAFKIFYIGEKGYSQKEKIKYREYKEFKVFDEPLFMKFVLLKVTEDHKTMRDSWFCDYGAKVETTFRMGLKGGLHLLFDAKKPVVINNMHFDGYKHHSGRHIDEDRIICRLENELRNYCKFDSSCRIEDLSSNHMKEDSQSYDDCQFLQLADLLVSGFRTQLGTNNNKFQKFASSPLNYLIEKWYAGNARMRNSRWFKSFALSKCRLENDEWVFEKTIKEEKYHQKELDF